MTDKKTLKGKFVYKRKVTNQKLSRDRNRRHSLFLCKIVVIGILIVLPLLFCSWQRIEKVQYGYSIEKARNELTVLKDQNLKLKLEKSKLSNLERVERIAREKLEMELSEVTDVTMVRVEAPAEGTFVASKGSQK